MLNEAPELNVRCQLSHSPNTGTEPRPSRVEVAHCLVAWSRPRPTRPISQKVIRNGVRRIGGVRARSTFCSPESPVESTVEPSHEPTGESSDRQRDVLGKSEAVR